MKKQRWLAKQRGGQPQQGGAVPNGRHGANLAPGPGRYEEPRQHSPLSRLVADGYVPTHVPTTAQQPYGQRPSSGSRGPCPDNMPVGGSAGYRPSSGSRGPRPDRRPSGGQFDAGVAGQWSANVRDVQQQRQNRHDPNVAGPCIHAGGQRVTQPAGGGASIDLSWQESAPQNAPIPPRMPVAQTPSQYQSQGQAAGAYAPGGGFAGTPGAGGAGGLRHQAAQAYVEEHGAGSSPWTRGPSPGLQRSGSQRERAASNTPFGTSSDVPQGGARQMPQRRDMPPPYGVDTYQDSYTGSSQRSGSRGVAGRDPNPMAAGGAAPVRGRGAGHTPGGASQIVFG